MAKEIVLRKEERTISDDDLLDEIPLIKRLEQVQAQKSSLVDGRVNTYCNVNEVLNQIRMVLTSDELKQFRTSAFGVILDVFESTWISGQLLMYLVGSCVRSMNECNVEKLIFRISEEEVVLTKEQFHLISGLKMGGLKGKMDNSVVGRFASRYFPSAKSVKRKDIANAFINFNRNLPGVLPKDVLKMSLIYALAHVFLGNQASVNLPMSYLSLVDDIDEFNSYPWGDDVWTELVDHIYRCASYIANGGTTRPTFGGYTFALQTWAFETFPSLAEAGMCMLVPDRVDSIPRCLRWKVCARFSYEKVSEALTKDGKVVWKLVEPSIDEMKLESVEELYAGSRSSTSVRKKKLSMSASKQVRRLNENESKTICALGNVQNEGITANRPPISGVKRINKRNEKGKQKDGERVRKKENLIGKGCGHLLLVDEIKEIKAKQALQDNKLDEILGFLQKTRVDVAVQTDGVDVYMFGANEKLEVREDSFGKERNTNVGVDLENVADMRLDAGGPSFDLLTPMPKVDAVRCPASEAVGRKESEAVECHGVHCGNILDIPYTETQYDPRDLEIIDKEAELHFNSLKNSEAVPLDSEEGSAGNGADKGKSKMNDVAETFVKDAGICQVTSDVHPLTEIKGSTGSNEGEMGQRAGVFTGNIGVEDEDFERFFFSSKVASGAASDSGVHDSLVVLRGASNSKTACVEEDRPKRVHKNTVRYTPTEDEHYKKKRKLDMMERAKMRVNRAGGMMCHGPFTEDPKEMPVVTEIEKVHAFVNRGILKRQGRRNNSCRYVSKEENMTKNPIVLDNFTVENKTWIYELFTPTEWLRSTHIEVAMHYLEVKGRQYSLLQAYTTTSPYFLQGLFKHQEMVDLGRAKKEDVIRNRNLTSEVNGAARDYARPWGECDFVYMPLNTGDHWILLVLEVEGRTIRLYNSKGGRSIKCREIRPYVPCLTELLPVLLDGLNVYDEHSGGPMGKQKLKIETVDGCPQQTDGCSCGMFVLKFAEYLMMDKDISEVHASDMEAYRAKMTTEFLIYSNEQQKTVEE